MKFHKGTADSITYVFMRDKRQWKEKRYIKEFNKKFPLYCYILFFMFPSLTGRSFMYKILSK